MVPADTTPEKTPLPPCMVPLTTRALAAVLVLIPTLPSEVTMNCFDGVTIVKGFPSAVEAPMVTPEPKTAAPGVCILPDGVLVPTANLLFDIFCY
jgi:hypothetical protein